MKTNLRWLFIPYNKVKYYTIKNTVNLFFITFSVKSLAIKQSLVNTQLRLPVYTLFRMSQ